MTDNFTIRDARARVILDSRGAQTIETSISVDGCTGVCGAPSGKSMGKTEAKPFRNGSARESVEIFYSKVRERIIGFNAFDQTGFDRLLREIDGTGDFSEIGGNLSTGLSISCAKAVSKKLGIPLYRYAGGNFRAKFPHPLGNVIGGGKHAINGTTMQEFLVTNSESDFMKSMIINTKVHQRIGKLIEGVIPGKALGVGDERAWVASINDDQAMDILKQATSEISHEEKVSTFMAVDMAASSYYENGVYVYKDRKLSRDEQIELVKSMVKERGFTIIEDPMDEEDFEGFSAITEAVGNRSTIIGDDIYTTNTRLIQKGIEMQSSNAVLIKVNQIGTLTEAWDAVKMATAASWKNVISHRSGETTDDFIAHLSVAFGSSHIKCGTIGGERLAKLNEVARIQEELKQ